MTLPLEHDAGDTPRALLWIVLAGSAIKLAFEASALLSARDRRSSALKRMALVMVGDLAAHTGARFACGIAGGILLPLAIGLGPLEASATRGLALVLLGLVLAGELLERYLFFRAAPASRMPGGLR
jgi:hypothetical protein